LSTFSIPRPEGLTTARLELAPLQHCNALELLDYQLKNKLHLQETSPQPPADYYTEEFWQRKIWSSTQDWNKGCAIRFVIRMTDRPEIIGTLKFSQIFRGPLHSCFLGYNVDEEFENLGLMTEALEKSITYLFEVWNLHRVQANYLVDNKKSARVLEKLGFTIEGLAPKYLYIKDGWHDHIISSLINENWNDAYLND